MSDQTKKPKDKISNLQEEIEKYKQEVLEGLQIEEEGLTDFIRKKTKQSPPLNNTQKYNDPTGDIYINSKNNKNGQVLKSISSFDTSKATLKTSANLNKIKNLALGVTSSTKDAVSVTKIPSTTTISSTRRKRHESRRKNKNK